MSGAATNGGAGASDQNQKVAVPGSIMARASGLAGWRKAIRRVASLEESGLAEIDELYDGLVPKHEQEEWIVEKLRLLKEETEAIGEGAHSGLKSRWEVLDRLRAKKVAAAERQRNRQIESVKAIFESELMQAADECDAEKATYQQELLDLFHRRQKRLDEDLKTLETEGTLENSRPQPVRKSRVRRGGVDNDAAQPTTRRRIAPFQSLMENGCALKEDEMEDDFNLVHRLAVKIGQ